MEKKYEEKEGNIFKWCVSNLRSEYEPDECKVTSHKDTVSFSDQGL